MARLEARGVELEWNQRGRGPSALLVHESATDSRAWAGVAGALTPGARVISYDRRGWGASSAPDDYGRTTVEEQSEDAAALLEAEAPGQRAVLAGAGLGAVIALDLLLRRPELVAGAVLVEPPLLALLPEATELLSGDRSALESAAGEGREAVVELYLSGGLGALAVGVERLPAELTAPARERPASLLAELGAIPGWAMPVPRLAGAERPALVLSSAATPSLLRVAAEALVGRLRFSELRELETAGVPHLADPGAVAAAAAELLPRQGETGTGSG